MPSTRADRIRNTLADTFDTTQLDVIDESSNHHVPDGAETHFLVLVVSEEYKELSLIKRHQRINHVLKDEFDTGLHALSIHAYTPDEWIQKQQKIAKSPACRDGFQFNLPKKS